jgi:hypothetical protein
MSRIIDELAPKDTFVNQPDGPKTIEFYEGRKYRLSEKSLTINREYERFYEKESIYSLTIYRSFKYPGLGTIALRRQIDFPTLPQLYINYVVPDEVGEVRFAKLVYDIESKRYYGYIALIEHPKKTLFEKSYEHKKVLESLRNLYPKYSFCHHNSELFYKP